MLSVMRTGVLRSVIQGQGALKVLAVVPVREKQTQTIGERIKTWDHVNSVYFGPERDMKNFPNPTQPDKPEPVRMGIIPNSWFEFFYPKTGVSGPYVFGAGLFIMMMSKEYMVCDHYFTEVPAFWAMCYVLCTNPKVGPKLKNFFKERMDARQEIEFDRQLNGMKEDAENSVNHVERLIEETGAAKHLYQVKKEGIELQLEAAYRNRLQTAYQEVKKRLDYELEKENVKRRYEQQHMVNWIVSSVRKSITPQQEKDSIKSCIETLKALAAKQQPATA